ncbi:MAG TPA: hypothetical protein VGV15_15585 [Terriglobales bacterium]|jgi:hypothetical protein|nr:hypothetical protein [Terriglobales bacterium]
MIKGSELRKANHSNRRKLSEKVFERPFNVNKLSPELRAAN